MQEVLNEEARRGPCASSGPSRDSGSRELAQSLVDLADQLGGSDNCTVLVACCY